MSPASEDPGPEPRSRTLRGGGQFRSPPRRTRLPKIGGYVLMSICCDTLNQSAQASSSMTFTLCSRIMLLPLIAKILSPGIAMPPGSARDASGQHGQHIGCPVGNPVPAFSGNRAAIVPKAIGGAPRYQPCRTSSAGWCGPRYSSRSDFATRRQLTARIAPSTTCRWIAASASRFSRSARSRHLWRRAGSRERSWRWISQYLDPRVVPGSF